MERRTTRGMRRWRGVLARLSLAAVGGLCIMASALWERDSVSEPVLVSSASSSARHREPPRQPLDTLTVRHVRSRAAAAEGPAEPNLGAASDGGEPVDQPVVAEANVLANALKTYFAGQGRDETWAPARESFVKALFASEVPGALLDIECRTNLCRMVIRAKPELLMSAIPLLQHVGGDHAPSPLPVNGNLEMWLSQVGTRIPDPDHLSRLALSRRN